MPRRSTPGSAIRRFMLSNDTHLYGPDVRGLTMADEVIDLELGLRVGVEQAMEDFVRAYVPEERSRSMHVLLYARLHQPGRWA
jgi:hypothetical protein